MENNSNVNNINFAQEPSNVAYNNGDSMFKNIKTKFSESFKKMGSQGKFLLLIIPLVAVVILLGEIKHIQSLRSGAANPTASVSFQLQNWSLPPKSVFSVWLDTSAPTSFVNLNITFDPTLIHLTNEPSYTSTALTKVIRITSMQEANSTGKINIVSGIDPATSTVGPSGPFKLADLTFDTNQTTDSLSTLVNFDLNSSQLVALDTSIFTLSARSLTLALNPTPSSIPTSVPVPTPNGTSSPGPTGSPIAASTPVISGITETQITSDTGTINWDTNVPTVGWLVYGPSKNNPSDIQSPKETTYSTTHSVTLSNLAPNTFVYYQINAEDASGTSVNSAIKKLRTRK